MTVVLAVAPHLGLPLTLALSPRAGRGDTVVFNRTRQRAYGISSPLPACGERVRMRGSRG
ncbi:hypothetical protein CN168_11085 [Sinorhizobium medicae]|nr:hypothetical protein CN168_11085 [Sinorhizobium medicae]